jgi:hypothetical protein
MGMVSAARSCLAFAMSTYITRPFSTCHKLAGISKLFAKGKQESRYTTLTK